MDTLWTCCNGENKNNKKHEKENIDFGDQCVIRVNLFNSTQPTIVTHYYACYKCRTTIEGTMYMGYDKTFCSRKCRNIQF